MNAPVPEVVTICYPWFRSPRAGGSGGWNDMIVLGKKSDTPSARKLKMVGKWNGGGGKFKPGVDLSVAHCAQRETEEDFGIVPVIDRIVEAGVVTFEKEGSLVEAHFSFVDLWTGDFLERSREMDEVRKFDILDPPYLDMMPADRRYRFPIFFFKVMMRGLSARMHVRLDADMNVIGSGPSPKLVPRAIPVA